MNIRDIKETVKKKQVEYEVHKMKAQYEAIFDDISDYTIKAIIEYIENEDVSAYDEHSYEIAEARRDFQVEICIHRKYGLNGIPWEDLQKHLVNKGVFISDAEVNRGTTAIKDGRGMELFRFYEPAVLTLSIDLNQFFN